MNERKNDKHTVKEKDYYFPVIVSQIFCCVLLLGLLFFMQSGESGQEIREKYSALLEEDFLTVEFSSVVSGIKDYLLEDSAYFAVNGSRVEPYNKEALQDYAAEENSENSTEEGSEAVNSDSVHEKETELPSLQGELLYSTEIKQTALPLRLSYKKAQKIISPVIEGRYTSYYGERTDPISEGSDFHNGIDIGADEGDIIRAVYDGKVISTGEDSRSGKYIFLSHEDGVVTFYCHCSKVLAKKGDKVSQGETIALVGSTGYSTGPHLHFEVRVNDVSVDPLPLLENAG